MCCTKITYSCSILRVYRVRPAHCGFGYLSSSQNTVGIMRLPIPPVSNQEKEKWYGLIDRVHWSQNKLIHMRKFRATNICNATINEHNYDANGLDQYDKTDGQKLHLNASFLLLKFLLTQLIDFI